MKIKICGLSRIRDIQIVNKAKPDYIGFIFAESRRKVTLAQAEELKKSLSSDISTVGVFANEPIEHLLPLIRSGVIDMVQLHGSETEEYIAELKSLAGKPVIKAVPVINAGDTQQWADTCADYLLFDNAGGGSGRHFNWDLIGRIKKPYFLAGGLNSANIEQAMQKTDPYAVDINSGVETDGAKDEKKIHSIISMIRRE